MLNAALMAGARLLKVICGDRRANVAVMTGLMSPFIIGGFGIGSETAYWYVTQRQMQNAADEAAVAAATNYTSTYANEAKAVASKMGYTDGVNNITVTASNTAACPGGGSNCYSVTISGKAQIYLAQIAGYTGNTTVNGHNGVTLSATSVAKQGTTPAQYCILALQTTGTGFQSNGAPNANLQGCKVMSDSNATCTGHNTNADEGDAAGTNSGCGNIVKSHVPLLSDPYSGLAASIPANTCKNYPQEGKKGGGGTPIPAGTWSPVGDQCGDQVLQGNVTVSPNTVLVIENGTLDLNGYTLTGTGLTIIFSGTSGNSYTHYPTDSSGGGTGALNYTAPTSGTWSGVAMYQDPSLTQGVSYTYAGNAPSWSITGLVYTPHADVTFSGVVNKTSPTTACFGLVVNTITVNGTADILGKGGCPAAGLTLPTNNVNDRGYLVN